MPVCPYAKQARQRQTLRVLECHNFAEFQDKIIEGARLTKDPAVQITIVGCNDIGYTPEELDSVIDILNRVMVPNDIYLMGSHPDDDDEDEPVEFLDTGEWRPDNSGKRLGRRREPGVRNQRRRGSSAVRNRVRIEEDPWVQNSIWVERPFGGAQ